MKCLRITSPDELSMQRLQNLRPCECTEDEETAVRKIKDFWNIYYLSLTRHLPRYENPGWTDKEEDDIELEEERFITWRSRPVGYLAKQFLVIFDSKETYRHQQETQDDYGYELLIRTETWEFARKTDRYLFFREESSPSMRCLLKLGDGKTERDIRVDRNIQTCFHFYIVTVDPETRNTISSKEIVGGYNIMPAADGSFSLVRITYTPRGSFRLMVLNPDGTMDDSCTPYRFDCDGNLAALRLDSPEGPSPESSHSSEENLLRVRHYY